MLNFKLWNCFTLVFSFVLWHLRDTIDRSSLQETIDWLKSFWFLNLNRLISARCDFKISFHTPLLFQNSNLTITATLINHISIILPRTGIDTGLTCSKKLYIVNIRTTFNQITTYGFSVINFNLFSFLLFNLIVFVMKSSWSIKYNQLH